MLHLDPQIRDYVLIPVIVVVIATSLIRNNLQRILGHQLPKSDLEEIKRASLMARIRNLRNSSGFLTPKNWEGRRAIYIKKDEGILWRIPAQKSAMEQMLSQHQDPSAATSMLTNQVSYIALHGTLGYWISHMFSGFVVAKMPFPLTFKIKAMFQRGIEVTALDSSYVSSLSFYFFVMMSSSAIVAIINRIFGSRGSENDGAAEVAMMATGGMPPPPAMGNPDIKKLYETERENLEIAGHSFLLDDVEQKLLDQWK